MRDVTLESTVDYKFTTTDADGVPTTLAGTPVISAYIGNSTTQLTAGITLTVDFDGVTGLHNVRVAATAANGYTTATDVALVITTGTVDAVSVVGYKVAEFSIGRASTANVTQWLGTAAATPTVAGVPEVDVTHWSGTAAATVDTAGYPKVTVKSGTGSGEVSLASGIASVNATLINSSANAAARLALAAAQIIPFTVDNTAHTPTTTEFETSTITEATASHFNSRLILWTTGALAGQLALVSAYVLTGGRGHFTVVAMTEAPANGDTGVLV